MVGDGVNVSDDTGVLGDVRSAETLEEGDGLRDDVVALTKGVDALVGLLDEVLVRAEAASVEVVLALSNEVEPGVQALGDDLRAGKLALRLLLLGLLRRSSLALNGPGDGLGDRADGGGDRNSLGDDDSGALLATALRLLRAAVGDGLDLSGEHGGGGVVGGCLDSGLRSRGGGRSSRSLNRGADGASGLRELVGGSGRSLRRSLDRSLGGGLNRGLRGSLDGSLDGGGALARGADDRSRVGLRSLGGGSLGLRSRLRLGGGLRLRLGSGLGLGLRLGLRSRLGLGLGLRLRLGLRVGGRGRGGVVVTVEVEVGDLDLALVLLLVGLVREGDLEVGSTTALLVLDLVLALAAVVGLLADRAVGEAVVELEATVNLDVNLELLQGELVDARERAAGEGGGSVDVDAGLTDNVLRAALIFAGPAVEVEAVVEVELAGQEILPVKTTLELVVTLVVAVAGARELVSVVPLLATETEL